MGAAASCTSSAGLKVSNKDLPEQGPNKTSNRTRRHRLSLRGSKKIHPVLPSATAAASQPQQEPGPNPDPEPNEYDEVQGSSPKAAAGPNETSEQMPSTLASLPLPPPSLTSFAGKNQLPPLLGISMNNRTDTKEGGTARLGELRGVRGSRRIDNAPENLQPGPNPDPSPDIVPSRRNLSVLAPLAPIHPQTSSPRNGRSIIFTDPNAPTESSTDDIVDDPTLANAGTTPGRFPKGERQFLFPIPPPKLSGLDQQISGSSEETKELASQSIEPSFANKEPIPMSPSTSSIGSNERASTVVPVRDPFALAAGIRPMPRKQRSHENEGGTGTYFGHIRPHPPSKPKQQDEHLTSNEHQDRTTEDSYKFKPGDRVLLQGLSAAQYNGLACTVKRFSTNSFRYLVVVDGSEDRAPEQRTIKPKNLVLISSVSIHEKRLDEKGRDNSDLILQPLENEDGSGKAENHNEFSPGDRALLQGLSSMKYNGLKCTIKRFDSKYGRYLVMVDGTDESEAQQRTIRPRNLLRIPTNTTSTIEDTAIGKSRNKVPSASKPQDNSTSTIDAGTHFVGDSQDHAHSEDTTVETSENVYQNKILNQENLSQVEKCNNDERKTTPILRVKAGWSPDPEPEVLDRLHAENPAIDASSRALYAHIPSQCLIAPRTVLNNTIVNSITSSTVELEAPPQVDWLQVARMGSIVREHRPSKNESSLESEKRPSRRLKFRDEVNKELTYVQEFQLTGRVKNMMLDDAGAADAEADRMEEAKFGSMLPPPPTMFQTAPRSPVDLYDFSDQ